MAFRLLRFSLPFLEVIFPYIARRLVMQAFFKPTRFPLPEREKELLSEAVQFSLKTSAGLIRIYRWGEGPAVLFMHGWSSRAGQFHFQIRRMLEAGYSCVAFDAPAHGASEGRITDLFQFTASILAVHETQGPFRAVIAHSMGGAATVLAAGRGLEVPCMVIMNTPAIAANIIKSSCRMINASVKSERELAAQIRLKYGAPLEEYTIAAIALRTALPAVMLVYDQDDKDAPVSDGKIVRDNIPGSVLLETSGLGHIRSLRDEGVTEEILSFVGAFSSAEAGRLSSAPHG